jgi:hypothetical protein
LIHENVVKATISIGLNSSSRDLTLGTLVHFRGFEKVVDRTKRELKSEKSPNTDLKFT